MAGNVLFRFILCNVSYEIGLLLAIITLITGMPGNGKTLRAVWMLVQQINDEVAAKKKSGQPLRDYYVDIEGFDYDAVEALTGCRVKPAPDDWRTTPPGSMLVYDEAHRRFPSTGRPGRADDPVIRDMDTHRHGGYDIVLITQWPTKIHHEVRSLMGTHVHMNRSMGLEAAGVLTWARVQIDPYDERQREKAEEELWRFPRDIYKLYRSATIHTTSHKFRMPRKFWSALSVLITLIVLLWLGYMYLLPDGKATDSAQGAAGPESASALGLLPPSSKSPSDPEPPQPGAGAFKHLDIQTVPTLAGCISSDRGCRCFASSGLQIDMDQRQCRHVMTQPLPFNIYHEYKAPASAVSLQPSAPQLAPSAAGVDKPTGAVAAASVAYGEGHKYGAFELSPVAINK